MRRHKGYDIGAVLAARGERLRARQEAAAAEVRAEREGVARRELEEAARREARWRNECAADRERRQAAEAGHVLRWPGEVAR